MIVFAVDDRLERAHRILDLDELPGDAGEHLGDMERLGEEALQLAGAVDGELILFRELVHSEDRDDVLKRLVALKRLLDSASSVVMLLADGPRGQHPRGRIE